MEVYADLIVEDKVIIELKATNRKVGLLINFSNNGLEYKRVVN